MDYQAAVHSTFAVTRTYPRPPAAVFAAFSDPAKKRRWFAEGDRHDMEAFEMSFQVGGAERFRYRLKPGTPFPGVVISNEGIFHDIVPDRRVVVSHLMTVGERRISSSLATFELFPDAAGTRLLCTFQGVFFEGSDGPQIREGGWRKLLERLDGALDQQPGA